MKKWVMTQQKKSELTDLAVGATKAYGKEKATASPKFKGTADERKAIVQQAKDTMEVLKQAVSQLTLEAVKELATWIQYKATHDPVEPVGQGKSAWNKKMANELCGALWSLVNALRDTHGAGDDRVRQASNRANSTNDFVKVYNQLGGLYPRNGMTYESKEFGLKKLDEAFQKAKAEGNIDRARELNDLYAKAQKSLAFMKPAPVMEHSKNITVNADPSKGIATLGETLQPVGESAPAETREPAAPAAATAANLEQPNPGKPKGSGRKPFVSERPGKKSK